MHFWVYGGGIVLEGKAMQQYYRQLPKVDDLLADSEVVQQIARYGRDLVLAAVRETLQRRRQQLNQAETDAHAQTLVAQPHIVADIVLELEQLTSPNLRRVINATGVVLHTNLGRAVLSDQAVAALTNIAQGYSNLELDLTTGKRGSRYSHVEELLCRLTGAEAALVVNNNAAAVLLALTALAKGQEVIVSRGQLVEIGGAFRIPEVMEQSGCRLREVGSTNKTHLHDYQGAINDNTALLLKVHTSNYRVVGFTQEVDIAQLAELGHTHGLPVMDDLGSGFLVDLKARGIGDEPTVQTSISAGADVVTFSGDKLLGGPQAGIIVGRKQYIDMMKKHPLNRAVRIDKFTVAALEATLLAYLDEGQAMEQIPTLRMLTWPKAVLQQRAEQLAGLLREQLGTRATIEVRPDQSQVGGGAMPLTALDTYVVTVSPQHVSVNGLAESLRQGKPALMARTAEDKLVLDMRTILAGQEEEIPQLLSAVLGR